MIYQENRGFSSSQSDILHHWTIWRSLGRHTNEKPEDEHQKIGRVHLLAGSWDEQNQLVNRIDISIGSSHLVSGL